MRHETERSLHSQEPSVEVACAGGAEATHCMSKAQVTERQTHSLSFHPAKDIMYTAPHCPDCSPQIPLHIQTRDPAVKVPFPAHHLNWHLLDSASSQEATLAFFSGLKQVQPCPVWTPCAWSRLCGFSLVSHVLDLHMAQLTAEAA